jgi:hypothetical protein
MRHGLFKELRESLNDGDDWNVRMKLAHSSRNEDEFSECDRDREGSFELCRLADT